MWVISPRGYRTCLLALAGLKALVSLKFLFYRFDELSALEARRAVTGV
jgi:hypothetical protein